MRLTPSQIAMLELLGECIPFRPRLTLEERIRQGHATLVRITRQDFGFDARRWHDYLRETNAGGYRWSNKHLGMPKRIAKAIGDLAWCRAVEEVRDNTKEGSVEVPR